MAENVSPLPASMSTVRQTTVMTPPIVSSPPIKSATSHPDKIRPITKTSPHSMAITSIQSPSKSSTTSSINTDVPHIEINSPSPNSSVVPTLTKLKSTNRDQYVVQSRFPYDNYGKQSDDSTSHTKSPNTQRKPTKTSTTISTVKQRDHSDGKQSSATRINGNPSMNRSKMASPRHASTSSEEQHMTPPMPMKPVSVKEPTTSTLVPLVNSHLMSKKNQPARLFIALFDYDPNAMSPNKDNDEELPFIAGQLIRVRPIAVFYSVCCICRSCSIPSRFMAIKIPTDST
jgi:hypothetical protein